MRKSNSIFVGVVTAVTIVAWSGHAVMAASDAFSDPAVAVDSWTSAGNGAYDRHDAPYERQLGPRTISWLQTRWTLAAYGEVWGTPTVGGNAVHASDTGGSVWRIDARTGKADWEVKLPAYTGLAASFSRVSPAIGRDTIVVGDQAPATLFALSKQTGALVWKTTNGYTGGVVWATQVGPGGHYGGIEYGTATDGKRPFSLAGGGASVLGPAIAGGNLFWSSGYRNLRPTNNKIYSLGPAP